jgi:hypothetical protein
MGPPPAENLREKTPAPDFKREPERATAPYHLGALGVRVTPCASFRPQRPQDLSGLRVHQMGLGARKARHLDVGEVIVFASISGPRFFCS